MYAERCLSVCSARIDRPKTVSIRHGRMDSRGALEIKRRNLFKTTVINGERKRHLQALGDCSARYLRRSFSFFSYFFTTSRSRLFRRRRRCVLSFCEKQKCARGCGDSVSHGSSPASKNIVYPTWRCVTQRKRNEMFLFVRGKFL